MLQELVVRQRDELLHRARRQLRVRDLIIAAQQELLEEHGLTVGPHVESLFGRLDTIEDIFKLDDDRTGLNAMVNQGLAEDGGVSGIELAGAQKWSLGKAIYPVSKIDDIVQVNLARSLQVPRKAEASSRQAKSRNRGIGGGRGNRRNRRSSSSSSSSKHHQHDGDSSVKTMSSAATEPEEIGHGSSGQAARRSTRPKVSRSRSQISVHNGRKRMHNISTNNPYQQSSREPTARELERAKRRGGNVVKEPKLVVWEQKQQDSGHTKPPTITTSSSSSSSSSSFQCIRL